VADSVPSVTVVIAARPGQAEIKAVTASQRLAYPSDKLEIIVARGRQPSVQRNTALRAARGELIYFLDDDSVPEPANLTKAAAHFASASTQMVGGPNVCPEDAPTLEQIFGLTLASWLAFGPSRARYISVGAIRSSSEKELILCNLMARRASLLELGGFNEALYPNEENALMDELQKRGGHLIYDPDFLVRRRPRSSLGSFCRMLMTYGRGRAEQFRLHPTMGSALNFVPPLFLVYLIITALGLAVAPLYARWLTLPLFAYALALVLQGAALFALQAGSTPLLARCARSVAAVPLVVLSHLLYGFGFWKGLFTHLDPKGARQRLPVDLEVVKPLDSDFPKPA
jgi:succinoglycan biosynthesis protein ExoA